MWRAGDSEGSARSIPLHPWLWVVNKEKEGNGIGPTAACTARPDDAKEIIEASGIRLGLELAKSIIANQFFDDLCPLLFGLGIAHDGTGIFTNSYAKSSASSAGSVSCNKTLKVPFPTQMRHFGFLFCTGGPFLVL